jgi:hypothetical protein
MSTGIASVRERLVDYAVSVQHEAVVPDPVFGMGRWPERPVLQFTETHLRCSTRMSGRGNSQLCVLATAVAESTDDTIGFVSVDCSLVSFYAPCDDGNDAVTVEEVYSVDANGVWRQRVDNLRCRHVASYHHNRCDVVDAFDNNRDGEVRFGELHMTLRWADGLDATNLVPEGPNYDDENEG